MFIILLVRSRGEWTREMFFLFKENGVYAVSIFKGKQLYQTTIRAEFVKDRYVCIKRETSTGIFVNISKNIRH